MYEPISAEFVIGGETYRACADLSAYMRLHEIARQHPERHIAAYDEDGEEVGLRMEMTPENLPDYFAAVTKRDAAHWEQVCQSAHPQELTLAWQVVDQVLTASQRQWEADQESPFRPQPEEPVADV